MNLVRIYMDNSQYVCMRNITDSSKFVFGMDLGPGECIMAPRSSVMTVLSMTEGIFNVVSFKEFSGIIKRKFVPIENTNYAAVFIR